MTNEFKKIDQGNITRYVLENASGGGTSSGSVASVSMPMGGMQRRKGDNLIAQEGDKKKVPASTPRNFVAKNAKSSGAGAHKDKKKEAKQGNVKHKKPFMENRDHPDHEIQMASSELMSIAKNAQSLLDMVQRYSEQEGLDAWQQSKITKAADYLNSVLQSINGEQHGVAEGDAGLSKDAETNFHAKLDQLVHATFGKRKSEQDTDEDMSRRGFLKGAGAMAAGISAASGARADNQTDPNKLIAIVNIDGESKEFNLTGRFKGDVKSQLHQAEDFITEFLEKRDINFSNLELRYQGAVLKTQNTGSVKEDDSALNAFLSKGGKVQQLPYKKPRKADKTDYGSKHIGGGGDKMKASRTGTAAKTQGSKVVGVAEGSEDKIKQLKNESVDPYFESLQTMVERQLEPTMDLDTWVDNFQNADPQKYHQFKNKTPEKKK